MKLDVPLLKLPRQYCAETLAAEVAALPRSAWIAHPGKLAGNDAVPLITPGGVITNGFAGPMAPTEHLLACCTFRRKDIHKIYHFSDLTL